MIFHVGSDEVPARSPRAIKRDFSALGQLVKGSGAQVVFSFIPPVTGNGGGKQEEPAEQYLAPSLVSPAGLFDHGLTLGLLATDRVHLSQREKLIFIQEVTGLAKRALNWI